MSGFATGIGRFAAKAQRVADRVVRASQLEISNRIQRRTPVAEEFGGRARASWQASQTGTMYFYVSNIPYIRKLEYGGYTTKPRTRKTILGFSSQLFDHDAQNRSNPVGMVRMSALEWRDIVEDMARIHGAK